MVALGVNTTRCFSLYFDRCPAMIPQITTPQRTRKPSVKTMLLVTLLTVILHRFVMAALGRSYRLLQQPFDLVALGADFGMFVALFAVVLLIARRIQQRA